MATRSTNCRLGAGAPAGRFSAACSSRRARASSSSSLGRASSSEPSRYGFTYHEERRDNFFMTAVRLHVRGRRKVDIEPVLGFDIVKEQRWSQTDHADYTGGNVTHSARYESTPPAAAGFSVGADLRVGSGHAGFIASFRAHRTFWGGSGDFDETKVWTLRPAAGVRVAF